MAFYQVQQSNRNEVWVQKSKKKTQTAEPPVCHLTADKNIKHLAVYVIVLEDLKQLENMNVANEV